MPRLGIDDSRPALARSSPRSMCSVGIRNAAPLMNTFANIVVVNAIASIDQRRTVPMVSTVMGNIVAQRSHPIELSSHIMGCTEQGVAADAAEPPTRLV